MDPGRGDDEITPLAAAAAAAAAAVVDGAVNGADEGPPGRACIR